MAKLFQARASGGLNDDLSGSGTNRDNTYTKSGTGSGIDDTAANYGSAAGDSYAVSIAILEQSSFNMAFTNKRPDIDIR